MFSLTENKHNKRHTACHSVLQKPTHTSMEKLPVENQEFCLRMSVSSSLMKKEINSDTNNFEASSLQQIWKSDDSCRNGA